MNETPRELMDRALGLRALLQGSATGVPVLIFAVDAEGAFTVRDGLTDEDLPRFREGVRRALAGEGFTSGVETRGKRWEVRFDVVRDARGALAGVVGVGLEADARRQADDEGQRNLWFLNA